MSQARYGSPEDEEDRTRGHHVLFANSRRRTVLAVLTQEETQIDIESLARRVATRESDSEAVPAETVEQVQMTLYHLHLPLLAELDLVDYDRDAGTVEITEEGRDRLQLEQDLANELAAAA